MGDSPLRVIMTTLRYRDEFWCRYRRGVIFRGAGCVTIIQVRRTCGHDIIIHHQEARIIIQIQIQIHHHIPNSKPNIIAIIENQLNP